MDCKAFMGVLGAFVEGRLEPPRREAAERHLEACPICSEVAALARGEEAVFTGSEAAAQPPAGLAEEILQRTSGSPCASARDRLCDHVDGELGAVDEDLVRLHLECCDDCSALAQVLKHAAADLPMLAELEPDAAFTSDVLARTLPARPAPEAARVPWADRLAETWQSLIRRPRFAWEGAYVGMFALALLFGTPNSPLAGVPRKALDLARGNPVQQLKEPVGRLESGVAGSLQRAWEVTASRVAESSKQAATGVASTTVTTVQEIKEDLSEIWQKVSSDSTTSDNDPNDTSQEREPGTEGDER